ncbi:GGDEF domain-containing protein [Thalassomonas viridans]|uniref:diguanylate cyclase n=1 Tax=Thalassomonas viridans TaxID=137584 RepID=A0AAF0C809_9GAMM|nr:sensor domain-containing diguanylate cyclase [Thalassomonas viridans]WDE03720.1 GGDEF domain-containing protein [Thalassomonas viridans]
MAADREQLGNKLFEFVEINEEGYAIFDARDHLLYCNRAYARILGFDAEVLIGRTFVDIISLCFNSNKGFKTDTDDLDVLLARLSTQWRSDYYRLFEMQNHENQWFLFSEIKNASGEILIQTKQVTEQKVLEQKLLESRDNLRQLALTDELTQVANRRCFVDSVEAELHRCRRHNYRVAYMILDLDHFKRINDSYGHQAGDMVLQHVAKLVKKLLRNYDIFGRIGGEEFAVFLGRTRVEEVLLIAERIREAIADTPLSYNGDSIRVTTSIGISLCTSVAHTYPDLYNQADQALYQAKANGRNMCQFHQTEHQE